MIRRDDRRAAADSKRWVPCEHDHEDDDHEEPVELACTHCRGDGMDPECDYLLPCPACQGEQR